MASADSTVRVKLTSARCGHTFDKHGNFTGTFAQAAGEIVEMSSAEAERHFAAGLASPITSK